MERERLARLAKSKRDEDVKNKETQQKEDQARQVAAVEAAAKKMATREGHLEWAKGRALECLVQGDRRSAVLSLISDFQKYSEVNTGEPLYPAGSFTNTMLLAASKDLDMVTQSFITGFN